MAFVLIRKLNNLTVVYLTVEISCTAAFPFGTEPDDDDGVCVKPQGVLNTVHLLISTNQLS